MTLEQEAKIAKECLTRTLAERGFVTEVTVTTHGQTTLGIQTSPEVPRGELEKAVDEYLGVYPLNRFIHARVDR
jgi:hypothetical protein